MEAVIDRYAILTAEPVDEEGRKPEKRITGYDMLPADEHDVLTAVAVSKLWREPPDYLVESLPASEFLRRVAIVRASEWSQPTPQSIAKARERSRMGRY